MAAGGRGNPISQVVLRRPADPGTFGYESRKGGYGRRGFRGNPIPPSKQCWMILVELG